MTKEEIIKKASDLGFKSPIIGKSVNSTQDKPFYYLWLCELKLWLLLEYNLLIEIEWDSAYEIPDSNELADAIFRITIVNICFKTEWVATSPDFQRKSGKCLTYLSSLEFAVDYALNILQSINEGKEEYFKSEE